MLWLWPAQGGTFHQPRGGQSAHDAEQVKPKQNQALEVEPANFPVRYECVSGLEIPDLLSGAEAGEVGHEQGFQAVHVRGLGVGAVLPAVGEREALGRVVDGEGDGADERLEAGEASRRGGEGEERVGAPIPLEKHFSSCQISATIRERI